MTDRPTGNTSDPELPDDEVQPANVRSRKLFFSIPEGYWDMSDEEQDAFAEYVATRVEQEYARSRDEASEREGDA